MATALGVFGEPASIGDIESVVETFLQAMEARRSFVVAHARRVSTYAVRLASQYGLGAGVIDDIRVGALLHDVGKLLIPLRILTKPARLNEREWVVLRSHPAKALDLLSRIGLNPEIRDIIQHHHERYDGHGYPDGLAAGEIAWPVRIVSVMDSFDALTSPREYREPLSASAARALIAREAGTRFCPWVVSGLMSLPLPLLEPATVEGCPSHFFADGLPTPGSVDATRAWRPSESGSGL